MNTKQELTYQKELIWGMVVDHTIPQDLACVLLTEINNELARKADMKIHNDEKELERIAK